jgi:hypothetical protein
MFVVSGSPIDAFWHIQNCLPGLFENGSQHVFRPVAIPWISDRSGRFVSFVPCRPSALFVPIASQGNTHISDPNVVHDSPAKLTNQHVACLHLLPPGAVRLLAPPLAVGPLTFNFRLVNAEKLWHRKLRGPESFAFRRRGDATGGGGGGGSKGNRNVSWSGTRLVS